MSGSPALPSPQEYLKAKDTRKADTDEVRQLMSLISRAMRCGRTSVTVPTPQGAHVIDEVGSQLESAGYTFSHKSGGLVCFSTIEWGVERAE